MIQRLMRMAACLSWLPEPLEEITPEVQWFMGPDPAEHVDPAAPDMIVRFQ